MAKVKTFYIAKSVPDASIAEFITECEKEYYVNVTTSFMHTAEISPRLTVIVTKLDEKDHNNNNNNSVIESNMLERGNYGNKTF